MTHHRQVLRALVNHHGKLLFGHQVHLALAHFILRLDHLPRVHTPVLTQSLPDLFWAVAHQCWKATQEQFPPAIWVQCSAGLHDPRNHALVVAQGDPLAQSAKMTANPHEEAKEQASYQGYCNSQERPPREDTRAAELQEAGAAAVGHGTTTLVQAEPAVRRRGSTAIAQVADDSPPSKTLAARGTASTPVASTPPHSWCIALEAAGLRGCILAALLRSAGVPAARWHGHLNGACRANDRAAVGKAGDSAFTAHIRARGRPGRRDGGRGPKAQ
mmetsp:Transcript_66742/g.155040  ORF Transcript_66742/g.155040 Transcript_66742/m.155040 type:complete len:273 (-) Transcript_66742:248-1066(-)